MALLHAADLEKSFGDRIVLRGCGLTVNRGDRVGLVGANGCGKSTLLRLLAGSSEPDAGRIQRDAKTGYLCQEPKLPGETVGEAAREALAWHDRLLADYHEAIANGGVDAAADLQAQLDIAGWDHSHRVDAMLARVGAPNAAAKVASLSGGETRRVALARVLLQQPDLMLLDEPTNHLDSDTIEWLEGFLRGFRGAVVMVTHDRYMLEAVANQIIEVEDGETVSYVGSYGDYLVERVERRARLQKAEDRRLSMIAREAAWAARSPAARTGKQKGRLKRLDELRQERDLSKERDLSFGFKTGFRAGNTLVEMFGIRKAFGESVLIDNLDFTVRPGDRIGILGPNGCGKSTLLNMISRKLQPDAGDLHFGPRVRCALLDQHRTGLKSGDTVLESVGSGGSHVQMGEQWITIQSYLGRFLFDRTHFDQKVDKLSGGERARLLMAKLLLEGSPLLLLDEPTNDLDLLTLRVLEEALLEFDGGAVIVTHDRAFLDRVCTSVLASEGDGLWTMYASREQHVEAQKRRAASEGVKQAGKDGKAPKSSEKGQKSSRRPSFKEKREFAELPERIETLEREQEELSDILNHPDTYRDRADEVATLTKRLADVERTIEACYERWSELEAIVD